MTGFRLARLRRAAACAGGLAVALQVTLGGAPALSGPQADPVREAGKSVFDKWCSDCHRPAGGPGSLALERKYQGALPAVLEQRTDLDPAAVKRAVRQGVSFMPSFRKTEISDADLTNLAVYLAPKK